MKDFRKNMKMPIDAKWLVPGLQVKRWFALILFGAVLMTLGVLILFDIRPVFYTMEFVRKIAMNLSTGRKVSPSALAHLGYKSAQSQQTFWD